MEEVTGPKGPLLPAGALARAGPSLICLVRGRREAESIMEEAQSAFVPAWLLDFAAGAGQTADLASWLYASCRSPLEFRQAAWQESRQFLLTAGLPQGPDGRILTAAAQSLLSGLILFLQEADWLQERTLGAAYALLTRLGIRGFIQQAARLSEDSGTRKCLEPFLDTPSPIRQAAFSRVQLAMAPLSRRDMSRLVDTPGLDLGAPAHAQRVICASAAGTSPTDTLFPLTYLRIQARALASQARAAPGGRVPVEVLFYASPDMPAGILEDLFGPAAPGEKPAWEALEAMGIRLCRSRERPTD